MPLLKPSGPHSLPPGSFILVKHSEAGGRLQGPPGLTPWLAACC